MSLESIVQGVLGVCTSNIITCEEEGEEEGEGEEEEGEEEEGEEEEGEYRERDKDK